MGYPLVNSQFDPEQMAGFSSGHEFLKNLDECQGLYMLFCQRGNGSCVSGDDYYPSWEYNQATSGTIHSEVLGDVQMV